MRTRLPLPTRFFQPIENCLGSWFGAIGFILAMLLPLNVVADEEGFTEDAKAAIERAVKEDKELILYFTGSDWCPPCQKLDREVFSEKEFLFEVSKHYVLVKFDFPKQTEQDPETAKQNQEYAEMFGIDSFPTLVLTDNLLKPFAFASYEEGGFQNYLALLEEARQLRVERDENLKKAEGKTGAERAKFLDQAIGKMREEIIRVYYPEIVAEIVKIDKDGELGLRAKWNAAEDAEMRKVIMTDVMMISRLEKPQRAIEFIDEVLKEIDFTNSQRLEIYQIKLNLVRQMKDDARIDALLDEMIALDGVEGETRQRLIVKKIYLMIGSGRRKQAMKLLDESIAKGSGSMHLYLAKGELHNAEQEYKEAISAFDEALKTARGNPDIMIELVSARADALYAIDDAKTALQSLDSFADDTQMPSDLRAEALLHKSLIMREMKRSRQARLAENRAIEVSETPKQKAEMQKIVDRLRKKYGG